MAIDKTGRKMVSFYIPMDLIKKLENARWEQRLPKQRIIEKALKEYFDRLETTPTPPD